MNRLLPATAIGLCALAAAPAVAQSYTATVIANGLTRPVYAGAAPGDTDRLFILEQRSLNQGRIRIFDLNTGTLLPTPFASFTVSTLSEQGLLGLAFHPDFQANGRMFVNYTLPAIGTTQIVEIRASAADPDVMDPSSERLLMTIEQPFGNHNANWMGFGPDGYLYIASGDGGAGNDPQNRAQDLGSDKGKLLRIDVDRKDPGLEYAIPADNPFVGVPGAREEVWASGLRNVWRADFDPLTGDLYMADVGQNSREEINFQPAGSPGGENYGWRCLEGTRTTGLSGCAPGGPALTDPIAEYTHEKGCSVTGGIVYRGCGIPSLHGAFLYADFCSQRIWMVERDAGGGWASTEISDRFTTVGGSFSSIVHFGRDNTGGLYIVSLAGRIFRVTGDEPTADWDGDGVINIFDVTSFITRWNRQDPATNINGDDGVDILDVVAFIELWSTPCG